MRKRLSYPLYLGLLLGGVSACQDAEVTQRLAKSFVPSAKSPNGAPMLIVANEVSGTVAVLQPTH